jgi:diguanylate cyclase (GGDEF)-like protein
LTSDKTGPPGPGPGHFTLVPVRSWTLWQRPRRLLLLVLAVELAAVLLTIWAMTRWPVTGPDLVFALIIVGCAELYVEVSRHIESIRQRVSRIPHGDLNSMWTFAAVLVLAPALVPAVVSVNYVHRWFRIRHHVVHRQVFTAAATVLAGYAAVGMLVAVDNHPALSSAPQDVNVMMYLLLVAAGITYFVVRTVLVCAAILLSRRRPKLASLAADPEDVAIELAGIGLGVLVAWALNEWLAMVTIIFGIALVLHGTVLARQLRDVVRVDPKTGLLNVLAWTSAARRWMSDTGTSRSVGLLMVDLDHFKLVNDVYGHVLGDDVLAAVATTITSEVRDSDDVATADLVGRFGGEEFAILLWNARETAMIDIAERIRQRIGSIPIFAGDNASTDTLIRVTCSVGAAISPRHGIDLDQLLQAAGNALDHAKRSGRNQVRLAKAE